MIGQLKADMQRQENIKPETVVCIATGGFSDTLAPITAVFDKFDMSLTLNGLHTIAKYALK